MGKFKLGLLFHIFLSLLCISTCLLPISPWMKVVATGTGWRQDFGGLKLKLAVLTATRSGKNYRTKPRRVRIWRQRGLVYPKGRGSGSGLYVGIWSHGLGDENKLEQTGQKESGP